MKEHRYSKVGLVSLVFGILILGILLCPPLIHFAPITSSVWDFYDNSFVQDLSSSPANFTYKAAGLIFIISGVMHLSAAQDIRHRLFRIGSAFAGLAVYAIVFHHLRMKVYEDFGGYFALNTWHDYLEVNGDGIISVWIPIFIIAVLLTAIMCYSWTGECSTHVQQNRISILLGLGITEGIESVYDYSSDQCYLLHLIFISMILLCIIRYIIINKEYRIVLKGLVSMLICIMLELALGFYSQVIIGGRWHSGYIETEFAFTCLLLAIQQSFTLLAVWALPILLKRKRTRISTNTEVSR